VVHLAPTRTYQGLFSLSDIHLKRHGFGSGVYVVIVDTGVNHSGTGEEKILRSIVLSWGPVRTSLSEICLLVPPCAYDVCIAAPTALLLDYPADFRPRGGSDMDGLPE